MNRADILAVLSAIIAGASVAISADLGPTVDLIAPGYGKIVLAVITLVSIIAATLSRVISNPSPPVGTVSAVIAPGSVPVVAVAPGTGAFSVAAIAPAAILGISAIVAAERKT